MADIIYWLSKLIETAAQVAAFLLIVALACACVYVIVAAICATWGNLLLACTRAPRSYLAWVRLSNADRDMAHEIVDLRDDIVDLRDEIKKLRALERGESEVKP